jgi:ABC-2 type transport system permease protein
MHGLLTVFRKELADHLGGSRFIILVALIAIACLSATYATAQSISEQPMGTSTSFVFLKLFTTSGGILPSLAIFISFLGPLIGIALGFDAINREENSGTLSRVLSQPIYRDSLINAKFLGGVTSIGAMIISIALMVSGLGLYAIGIAPESEEIWRVLIFLGISIIYIAFWMSLAVLFSILFKSAATSALAGIALWIFLAFFTPMIAGVAASAAVPTDQQSPPELLVKRIQVEQTLERVSPVTLFDEATITVLSPNVRTLSPLLSEQAEGMIPGPLPIGQSVLLVWPHIVSLIAMTFICFGVSYVVFMRREIRAP